MHREYCDKRTVLAGVGFGSDAEAQDVPSGCGSNTAIGHHHIMRWSRFCWSRHTGRLQSLEGTAHTEKADITSGLYDQFRACFYAHKKEKVGSLGMEYSSR